MSETDPIPFAPRRDALRPRCESSQVSVGEFTSVTSFNRHELSAIMAVYGRKVAAGEWRDYALDMTRDKATFSVFRRAAEFPLYRIEKIPRLARKQGAYCIVTPTGLILRRGHDLARVLSVLERQVRAVEA